MESRWASQEIQLRVAQTLCALVSSDDSKQQWLESAGIVNLLQRLTLDCHIDIKVPPPTHHRL